MKKQDFAQFATIWAAAHEVYGKSPTDGAVDMAFAALGRYDITDIRRALTAHVNNADEGRFAPKPADIVRQIDGDPKSRALSAWTKVEAAIGMVGPYESVVFDDHVIHAIIVDLGGWPEICSVTEKDLPFRRNEFCARYNGYLTRPPEQFAAHLAGISEAENRKDYPDQIPEQKLIGDQKKALAVMQGGGAEQRIQISGPRLALEAK